MLDGLVFDSHEPVEGGLDEDIVYIDFDNQSSEKLLGFKQISVNTSK